MNPVSAAVRELGRQFPARRAETLGEAVFGFMLTMGLLALLFWFAERRWADDLHSRRKPGSLRADIAFAAIGFLWDRTVLAILTLSVVVAAVVLRVPRLDTIVGAQPLLAQFFEAILLADLAGYWIHRAMHAWRPLWKLHAIHHGSEHLDWIAGARVHPFEQAISRSLAVGPLYLAGFSPVIYASMGPVTALFAIALHANLNWDYGRFRWWIASPRFHRWHHSSDPEAAGKNFAAFFPFLDKLFGTAYFPEERRPRGFGLGARDELPGTVWAQLKWPFQAAASRVHSTRNSTMVAPAPPSC